MFGVRENKFMWDYNFIYVIIDKSVHRIVFFDGQNRPLNSVSKLGSVTLVQQVTCVFKSLFRNFYDENNLTDTETDIPKLTIRKN